MKRYIGEEPLFAALSNLERRELPLDGFAPASVLIPILAFDGPPRVVLEVRTDEVEHHKNQISFPGGRRDGDEDAQQTALRETREEVDISPSSVRILGILDDIYTITNYRVTPFVGWVSDPVRLSANPRETAEALLVPIHELLDPAIHRGETGRWLDRDIGLHFYYWRAYTIWGATGMIMNQFLQICRRALG